MLSNVLYFSSVANAHGVMQTLSHDDLVQMVKEPVVAAIKSRDFLKLPAKDKLKYKDVGGYVFGESSDGLRKANSITFRTAATIDIDEDGDKVDIASLGVTIGCRAYVHTTISSTPKKPRYRVIVPFTEPVAVEEFVLITEELVSRVGSLGVKADSCSTVVTQIMFKPTVCEDMKEHYVGEIVGHSVLDPSKYLTKKTTEMSQIAKQVRAQQSPSKKKGYVGAFCKSYTIEEAIDTMLQNVYVEGTEANSYSYTKGTTQNGLKVFDDEFAYSFHDSDPCSRRLCSSFDLVRIHKFGNLDREAGVDYGTPSAPSFRMMVAYCSDVLHIKPIGNFDFSFLSDDSWTEHLTYNKKGIEPTTSNIELIFNNDDNLKGLFGFNLFEKRESLMRTAPWRRVHEPVPISDIDFSGLRHYLGLHYNISASGKIEDAMHLVAHTNQFHPIRDYLNSLKWDGKERVADLLIDYMGAVDTEFNRTVLRKFLLGAVNRVFNPGYKFDYVLILVGLMQGEGKSTLGSLLAGRWFSDSFLSFTGKESFEQLQGSWIIEIGELAGMRKAEVESIKHFITKRVDRFRPAYGRVVEEYPRQCVFFGTTNEMEFLKDTTGNRRFWPVKCNVGSAKKSIWETAFIQSIDQVWAEIMHYYSLNESCELPRGLFEEAKSVQRLHVDLDSRFGIVESFLSKPINDKYITASSYDRCAMLKGPELPNSRAREYVSTIEIWCECFENNVNDFDIRKSKEIAGILRLLGWLPSTTVRINKYYGTQRVFSKKQ